MSYNYYTYNPLNLGPSLFSLPQQPDNFYETLKMKELKELCRAANLSPTGLKQVLIDRLLNESTSFLYAREKRHVGHITNKALGELCRSREIKKSGNRYELILRLIQHDNNAADKANKKSSTSSSSTNKLKRSGGSTTAATTKKPKPSRSQVVYNKIQRKIASASTNKKYNSHWGSKTHSEDVYELLNETLQKEVASKNNMIEKKPKVALEIAKGAFTALSTNFDGIISPGYDMSGWLPEAVSTLGDIVMRVLPELNSKELTDLSTWVEELYSRIEPYGLDTNAEPNLEDILVMCEEAENGQYNDSDDDDDEDDGDKTQLAVTVPKMATTAATVMAANKGSMKIAPSSTVNFLSDPNENRDAVMVKTKRSMQLPPSSKINLLFTSKENQAPH